MAPILLIDDDDQVRGLLRRILERAGHSVVDAADGGAGVGGGRAPPAPPSLPPPPHPCRRFEAQDMDTEWYRLGTQLRPDRGDFDFGEAPLGTDAPAGRAI